MIIQYISTAEVHTFIRPFVHCGGLSFRVVD